MSRFTHSDKAEFNKKYFISLYHFDDYIISFDDIDLLCKFLNMELRHLLERLRNNQKVFFNNMELDLVVCEKEYEDVIVKRLK